MTELIQKLWSGYGQLLRVPLGDSSLILKLIEFPKVMSHPRGWNSKLSHERKKRSYEVESYWYKHYQSKNAKIPNYHSSGILNDNLQYLILEDLRASDFYPKETIDWIHVKMCLKWLAHFHRHNLGVKPSGLWPCGSYWHLDTRPDELAKIENELLKESAPLIDHKLKQAKFQSIIHGDAKLANFLFSNDEVAAVDFQYVGGGIGMKDVAYFLSSIYNDKDLFENESRCLDTYFSYLNLSEVEDEWRKLYPLAWCDFYRFLAGWSPSHAKINSYSEAMTKKALACL